LSQPPPQQPNQPPSSPGPPPGPPLYGGGGTKDAPVAGRTADPAPAEGAPRRLLGLLGALVVVAVGIFAFFALRGGSSSLNPVAEAAERTARISGARLALEVHYSVPGATNSFTGTGTGAFNARTGLEESTLEVPAAGGASMTMETVGNARVVYLRSPAIASQLPSGTDWMGMEPFLGHDAQTALGTEGGPQSSIASLETVGSGVKKLDQQTVRGHLTTRYQGSIEASKVAGILKEKGDGALATEFEQFAKLAPAPVQFEAWVDEGGLLRQVREVMQIPVPGGPAVTMDMRMQFFAFGSKPTIKLPPKHRVFDYTPVLRAELGMDDGKALGPLTAPAGAKALSVGAFHRRTKAVCDQMFGEARDLVNSQAGLVGRAKRLAPGSLDLAQARSYGNVYGARVEEPTYRILRRGTLRLARIAPPEKFAADYRRWLQTDAQQAEGMLAQARALRVGAFKSPALDQIKADAEAREHVSESAAAHIGIAKTCERRHSGEAQTTLG
jgi:hypothetical protein